MKEGREARRSDLPLTSEVLALLRAGDEVELFGRIYSARDAAHARIVEALRKGVPLDFSLENSIVYYMGPTPARPGRPIGSAGPTTSGRMDRYAPELMRGGMRGMIGKGDRSPEVREAIRRYGAVYFVATGGVGALIARCVKSAGVVAYPDLGPEAVYELDVEGFPAWVGIDARGRAIGASHE